MLFQHEVIMLSKNRDPLPALFLYDWMLVDIIQDCLNYLKVFELDYKVSYSKAQQRSHGCVPFLLQCKIKFSPSAGLIENLLPKNADVLNLIQEHSKKRSRSFDLTPASLDDSMLQLSWSKYITLMVMDAERCLNLPHFPFPPCTTFLQIRYRQADVLPPAAFPHELEGSGRQSKCVFSHTILDITIKHTSTSVPYCPHGLPSTP